jgi:hypothetical protein
MKTLAMQTSILRWSFHANVLNFMNCSSLPWKSIVYCIEAIVLRDRRGRNHMGVGFTTIYAISAYNR